MPSPNPATTDWVLIGGGSSGAGLPADTVVAAATRIISNLLLAGDTQPSWRVLGSGRMDWGPGGTTAVDTSLYRQAAGILAGNFDIWRVTNVGDANPIIATRYNAGGGANFPGFVFGLGGASAVDTWLYRNGIGILRTDGVFQTGGTIYANQGTSQQVAISSGGAKITFASTEDTNLYRNAAGVLKTDGVFLSTNAVPVGGTTGQALMKTSGLDYAMAWQTIVGTIPAGGTAGQVLSKISSTDYSVQWSGLPRGYSGTLAARLSAGSYIAGSVYFATDNDIAYLTDGVSTWTTVHYGIPSGGTAGQALVKNTATNFDVAWATIAGGSGLPADTVVVAGTRIISNKLLAGDAQPSWQVMGDGRMNWGPGGSTAVDTNLYRLSAQNLKTDNNFYAGQTFVSLGTGGATGYLFNPPAAAIGYAFSVNVQGEAQARHLVDGNGAHTWGPGGSTATDTTMYRSTVNTIRFSGTIQSGLNTSGQTAFMADGQNAGGWFIASRITGDANWRWLIDPGGGMYFGPGGSAAQDAFFGRTAVNQLQIGKSGYPTCLVIAANNTVWPFVIYDLANASYPPFHIDIAGGLWWGTSSASADTNLYRWAAGYLSTDNIFVPKGGINNASAAAATSYFLQTSAPGDSQARFIQRVDGYMTWGPGGSTAPDVRFYRSWANNLMIEGSLNIYPAAGTTAIIASAQTGDTNFRYIIDGNGMHSWGPGNTASDVSLFRGGAGLLQTNGNFWANGSIVSNLGNANQVYLTNPGGYPGIFFGNANDTYIYRAAANTLGVYNNLVVTGAIDGDMLQYYGDYAAGSYKDGDIVVQNGIAYLCVRPTSAAPTPWVAGSSAGGADVMAYGEITANVGVSSTTQGSPNTVITAPAITVDGATKIVIEFYCYAVVNQTNGAIILGLYEGGTSLGQMGFGFVSGGGTMNCPILVQRELTPTAGTHTYSIGAYLGSAGSGTVFANTGGNQGMPAFVRIRRVGPYSSIPGTVNYATTLPSSPVDGQRAILVDSVNNPTYQWEFRYNAQSTSAYKWEFVGGTPASISVNADQGTTATSPVDLATVGPSLTLPRAGAYIADFGAEGYNNTTGMSCFLSLYVVAVLTLQIISGTNAGVPTALSNVWNITGNQNDLVKLMYSGNGGTSSFRHRFLKITPQRVS